MERIEKAPPVKRGRVRSKLSQKLYSGNSPSLQDRIAALHEPRERICTIVFFNIQNELIQLRCRNILEKITHPGTHKSRRGHVSSGTHEFGGHSDPSKKANIERKTEATRSTKLRFNKWVQRTRCRLSIASHLFK